MKKSMFAAAAILLAAISCQKEIPAPQETPNPASGTTCSISINASKGLDTRALALDGSTISATWGASDEVAVCIKGGAVIGKLTPSTTGSAQTKLTGTIDAEGLSEGSELYLQYPYKAKEGGDGLLYPVAEYYDQDGSLGTIATDFDYATCGVTVSSIDDDGIHASDASFYNRQAIVKFSLKDADGQPLEVTKLIIASDGLAGGFYYDDYYQGPASIYVYPASATSEFTLALHSAMTYAPSYTLYAVTADGIYTKVSPATGFADGRYYAGSVKMSPLSHEDYETDSNWGVIGSISAYGANWGNNDDIAMKTDGDGHHVACGVSISEGDSFKLRADKSWSLNYGSTFSGVPDAVPAYLDGSNLSVSEGFYDIYLDANFGIILIVDSDTEPEELVWSLIGDFNSWNEQTEIDMVLTGGKWVSPATQMSGEFKLRSNHSWDNCVGIGSGNDFVLGEPFAAAIPGSNIPLPEAAEYIVTYDPEAGTVLVEKTVWSLIGDFNNWSADVDMVFTDGKWVSPATQMSGGFKLRRNHSWDVSDGIVGIDSNDEFVLGEPFAAARPGNFNIPLPEDAEYIVTYDPEAGTVLVEEYSAPAASYKLYVFDEKLATSDSWGTARTVWISEKQVEVVSSGTGTFGNFTYNCFELPADAVGETLTVYYKGENNCEICITGLSVVEGTEDYYYRTDGILWGAVTTPSVPESLEGASTPRYYLRSDFVSPYCHMWSEGAASTEWPGTAMTKTDSKQYGDNWYYVDILDSTVNFIFSDATGFQTSDLSQANYTAADGSYYFYFYRDGTSGNPTVVSW